MRFSKRGSDARSHSQGPYELPGCVIPVVFPVLFKIFDKSMMSSAPLYAGLICTSPYTGVGTSVERVVRVCALSWPGSTTVGSYSYCVLPDHVLLRTQQHYE